MSQLLEPSEEYQDSFLQAAREHYEDGTLDESTYAHTFGFGLEGMRERFPEYVRALKELSSTNRPPWHPENIYWLIDDGEYIGKVSIRHELNEYLHTWGGHIGYSVRPSKRRRGYGTEALALALEKASEIGLTRVLVTCDSDNIASRKVIEHNGGQFENAVPHYRRKDVKKLRFWIEVPVPAEAVSAEDA